MKEHIEIKYNKLKMRGYHEYSNNEKVVIVAHGIGGNKLGHKFVFKQFSDACTKQGISTIRMDFIGTGESEGEFNDTKHSDQVLQMKEIISFARNKLGYNKIYLCSTTIGCYAMWNSVNGDIKGIINWNPICNFDRYEKNNYKSIDESGGIDMNGLYLNPSYIKDLGNLQRDIFKLSCPVFCIQGELDFEAKYDSVQKTCSDNDWEFLSIKGGNHLWEGNQVRTELFQKTIEFVENN